MKNRMCHLKTVLIYLLCLLPLHAKEVLRIGLDHPLSITFKNSKSSNKINCSNHKNFINGYCRSKSYKVMINYLSKALDMQVEIHNIEDRNTLLRDFYNSKYDIILYHLNDFETAITSYKNKFTPLLTVTEQLDSGEPKYPYYYGDIVVKKETNIRTMKNLEGKRIGLRCYSVSGNDIPYMLLKLSKINLSKPTQLLYYRSSKEQMHALLSNKVDAIAVWNYYFDHYLLGHNIRASQFLRIARYKIPNKVFAANNKTVSQEIQTKFIQAMLKMPAKDLIGQSFSGVEIYNPKNYKHALSMLRQYKRLNRKIPICDKQVKVENKKIWKNPIN